MPVELRSPKKGLMNIKNKDRKCFLWCHVRHINLVELQKKIKKLVRHIIISVKIHPERITKKGKKSVNDLDYDGISCAKKDFSKIEKRNNICINVFCCENGLPFPIYISDQKFKNSINLLLITDGD